METAKQKIGLTGAIAVIAACMIGTGVFTSLGYQVLGIQSTFAIVVLWAVGGIAALCGALVYAELSVRIPGSGGEYNYLGKIYHPALGFLSGWTSATIGFAAPIAAAAMAFGKYFTQIVPAVDPTIAAVIVVLIAAGINFAGISLSETIQKGATYLNLVLIGVLIFCGLTFAGDISHFSFSIGPADWEAVMSHSFAVSLIYVSYAFSGWNAVTYVAGEVKDPVRTVPRSLVWSVVLVATLYVLLNFVFLYRVPMEELAGQNEVGAIAAKAIFGEIGGKMIAGMICLGLMASVLAMTIAGPRVTDKIGKDLPALSFLAKKNATGAPIVAILLQVTISLVLVLTATFDVVIRYVGFTLAVFTTLTVAGLLVLRWVKKQSIEDGLAAHDYKKEDGIAKKIYTTPLFPIPALLFIALELWMLTFTMIDHPWESLAGLGTVLVGLVVYFAVRNRKEEI